MTKIKVSVERIVMEQLEIDVTVEQYVKFNEQVNMGSLGSQYQMIADLVGTGNYKAVDSSQPYFNYGGFVIEDEPTGEELDEYYKSLEPAPEDPVDTTDPEPESPQETLPDTESDNAKD
ncbi:MAG: hypothetical protein [Bacteriophage sp.]|nr:MAG: hypothetical protein [Bacteriophage sp.]